MLCDHREGARVGSFLRMCSFGNGLCFSQSTSWCGGCLWEKPALKCREEPQGTISHPQRLILSGCTSHREGLKSSLKQLERNVGLKQTHTVPEFPVCYDLQGSFGPQEASSLCLGLPSALPVRPALPGSSTGTPRDCPHCLGQDTNLQVRILPGLSRNL